MADVTDITPKHFPIGVAKDMMELCPSAKAAVGIVVNKDDTLWYDMCGMQRKDILWALMKLMLEVLGAEVSYDDQRGEPDPDPSPEDEPA